MPLVNLKDIQISRILAENPASKSINILAKFKDRDGDVILLISKPPFTKDLMQNIISEDTLAQVQLENDIYSQYSLTPKAELNLLKSTVIYPATEKHINKYSDHQFYLLQETPNDYRNITLPFIEKNAFSAQWVERILKHESESENIIFEDPDRDTGFILLPDLKWDKKQLSDLYLVAICHRHGLRSLRDLTSSDLPLLRNIRNQGIAAIKEKYGVNQSQLRIYIHYQPSYYHFHVHFTHVKYEAPGSVVGRAHLLEDVIENLELFPNFYSQKTLSFVIQECDALLAEYRKCGRLT
ncbi:m7GpppX diphosphatase [Trichoplax sp. H2]|uniref:m7GpppX diphosphatase n=1 Tax=Trichoplax adhaerens TaxID=10228 RepID=B3RIU5_TRIAD|nr:hypothetical protein TRIADDRAFT_18652 [Trichoplax adhaerens]EDV29254.1 hypothetical protein TRIADDRAFT_18652 [Trichoplax adhaerens]RDD36687.1 m7GpppX diphosphatase [Trichoplax sp. H2]|eukprot:XP_002108456.1 hypothetical protein TRIADDRAFT_18652 [Trichoplax adhaerens]